MALSDKTISIFQQDFVSTGAEAMEAVLKKQLVLTQNLASAYTVLANNSGKLKNPAANKAVLDGIKNTNLEITAINRLIQAHKDLNRIRSDIGNLGYMPSRAESAQGLAQFKAVEAQRRQLGLDRGEAFRTASPAQMVQYQIDKWQQVFRRVFDALISFYIIRGVTTVVGGFFKSLIETNAQLENLDVRLKVMTGDTGSVAALRKEIITLTLKTPFIIKEFAEASVSLTAFGFNAKRNLKPVADWAAAIGRDLPDVALAFAKIATGSPRTALLLSTRGISKAEFDAEFKATGDRAEALRNIIQRKFGDMSYEVSKTFLGVISNIKDSWFLLASAIGKPLFESIRRDAIALYQILNFQPLVDNIGILGEAFNGLYQLIKVGLFPLLSLLIPVAIIKTMDAFKGLINILSTVSAKFASFIKVASLWAFAIIAVGEVSADIIQKFRNLFEAVTNLNDAFKRGGEGSTLYINALKQYGDSLKDLTNWWTKLVLLASAASQGPVSLHGVKGLIDWLDVEKQKIKDLIILNEELLQIRNELFKSKPSEVMAKDIMDFQDLMKGYAGAEEVIPKLIEALKQERAVRSKTDEGYAVATILINEMTDALHKTREELIKLAKEQALAKVRDVASHIVKGGKLGVDEARKTLREYLDLLAILETEKKGPEKNDRFAEIAAARERISELIDSESALFAKQEADLTLILGLHEQRNKLLGKGKLETVEYNKLQQLTLEIDQKTGDVIERDNRIRDARTAAQNRTDEAKRGNDELAINLRSKALEYEYSLTKDINVLYFDRHIQLAQSQDNLDEITSAIQRQYAVIEEAKKDPLGIEPEKAQAHMEELRKRQLQVQIKIFEIMHDINNLASRDFAGGLRKAFLGLLEDLNSFYDELAKIVVGGTREFITGTLKDLIFGVADKSVDEINKLKMDLQTTQQEGAKVYRSAGIIQRREGETNDVYLQRVQFATQLNSLAMDQYTFKTKELEIIEQINNLERSRNNIILERLAQLGGKIFDKILDQGIGFLMSKLSGAPSDISGGGGGPHGPASVFQPFGPVGGVVVNISGNQIFGESDFNKMVDGAIQKIDARRSR